MSICRVCGGGVPTCDGSVHVDDLTCLTKVAMAMLEVLDYEGYSIGLRRQTQDITNRVLFIVRYFPGVERLCYVLRSFQHVIDDNEHLAKIICKDAPRHGILARPCRCYDNGRMGTVQQLPDRNVPSRSGNTSAVKDIQSLIF
eukprot:g34892.t1